MATQLLGLSRESRTNELNALKCDNAQLYALVVHQLRKLRSETVKRKLATKEATDMGSDTPKQTEEFKLKFEMKGSTVEVEARGFEYCHEMASGLITFECLSGSKKAINALMTMFGDMNKPTADLRVHAENGVTTIFPAPNVLMTINYSYPGKKDTLVLQGVQFRFVREVVTMYPKGMEPKDDIED